MNTSGHYEKFLSFIKTCSEQDDTWKFGANSVLEDCISYIGLYLAIRCNNWNLRVSHSFKLNFYILVSLWFFCKSYDLCARSC